MQCFAEGLPFAQHQRIAREWSFIHGQLGNSRWPKFYGGFKSQRAASRESAQCGPSAGRFDESPTVLDLFEWRIGLTVDTVAATSSIIVIYRKCFTQQLRCRCWRQDAGVHYATHHDDGVARAVNVVGDVR